MDEFARCYEKKTSREFDIKKRHIRYLSAFQFLRNTCNNYMILRCLAHIINLATQALISTRSKSKYYDPASLDEHPTDIDGINRDEVGLVRAICVKV